MITAPAARSIDTTVASRAGVRPAWSTDPFSVGMSAVSMMSFTPTGTPWSGPSGPPHRRCLSAPAARQPVRVGRGRLRPREVGVEEGPGLDLRIHHLDAGQARVDQLRGGDHA